jgi:multidrug efflux pump subunit AcrB
MNIAEFWIENRVVTLVLTVVFIGGGISAFNGMSRLEDPEFTIKDALVVTPYPGASALEVEVEVSDEIEAAAQKIAFDARHVDRRGHDQGQVRSGRAAAGLG